MAAAEKGAYAMRAITVRYTGNQLLQYGVAILLAVIFFFPVVWMFLTSLKPAGEIYAWPPHFFPQAPTIINYFRVFTQSLLGRYILNSMIVSSFSAVAVIVLASMAAYGIARIGFRGSSLVLVVFIGLAMFPQLAIVPSIFTWFRDLGLINTYVGIVIAYVGLFTPIALWILTVYFRTIPSDLEESARIDGCGMLRMISHIILPVSIPGVVTAALIVIIQTWNEFFLALVILSRNHLRTATVGIALYPGEYAFPWDLITTATFMAILPIFFLTLVFQRRIIGGLTAGAIR